MLVKEEWVDRTEGYSCGDSDYYEPFTDNKSKLFKAYRKEYGKCVSRVYIDLDNGKTKNVGWVFQKKEKYEDCNEYYILETRVTLYSDKPTITRKEHYL